MASTYNSPSDYLAWIIRGNDLGILTSQYDSSTNIKSEWVAIDESVTDGILINYIAEPDTVTAITDYPDIDNTLHLSLVDYVKSRLYLDKMGKEEDTNRAQLAERLSIHHEKKWDDAVRKYGVKKRDKIGGRRTIIGKDWR